MSENQPWRSPFPHNTPTIIGPGGADITSPVTLQVSIPNEDPDTEDDLTLQFTFTDEGVIFDLLVSDGEPAATFGQMYDEFVNTLHDLDPMTKLRANFPIEDWKYEVANGDTVLGYEDWLKHQEEADR